MDKITKSASVTPILNVSDIATSFDYYVDKLKFIKAWDWGEPATFGSVYFGDKVELFFLPGRAGQSRDMADDFCEGCGCVSEHHKICWC